MEDREQNPWKSAGRLLGETPGQAPLFGGNSESADEATQSLQSMIHVAWFSQALGSIV